MSPVRRAKHTTPSVVLSATGDVVEVGGGCGLFIDLPAEDQAPAVGDWIATEAGSRYLVDQVRVVRRRKPAATTVRYQLRNLRLPKHTPPPDDVRVIWLTWYPRGRR
ncbi:hypothetical protein [Nocardioides sp.]|uniref:hypothetical protein n=1 Tax=Nocardioides sp. TaxID=35761 RepID=UPI0026255E72|nr:hypothetical protein [Nocardioides sp.]MDI6911504.1 hypothetical protein [Nocardioides sp.]